MRVLVQEKCKGWDHLMQRLEEVKGVGGEGCVAPALNRLCGVLAGPLGLTVYLCSQTHAPQAGLKIRVQALVDAPQGQDVLRRRGARRRPRAGQGA